MGHESTREAPPRPAVVLGRCWHSCPLCAHGQQVAEYRVALGRGGTGKQREGDLKTPLGVYPLGLARASAEFGLFLPVGYPTEGDWTRGCIAVDSDEAIQRLATWVREHYVTHIRIL